MRTLEPVEKAIKDARINKKQIEDVVLVGGSTRIPKIQTLLSNLFQGTYITNFLQERLNSKIVIF